MPRHREIFIKKDARIIVWKISETEDELKAQITNPFHIDFVKSRKAASSRKQYLATRIILEQEGVDHELKKDINGKPMLNEQFISITHDTNYVAVMLANEACGIDLQSVSEKVLRVQHKFMDEKDFRIAEDDLANLTIAWCIKEAIYKIHGDPMIYFKEHMRINGGDSRQAKASILHEDYRKDVTLDLRKIDDLYLSHTV